MMQSQKMEQSMTIDELQARIERLGCDVARDGNSLSAGGYLDLNSLATLPEGVTLSAGSVYSGFTQQWNGQSLRSVDGIVMVMGDSHSVGHATVYRATYFGRGDDSEHVYVAFVGDCSAHGSTVREAVEDAIQKGMAVDPSNVVAEIKASGVVTRLQYRTLTGACREGVRQWCDSHSVGDDIESLPLSDVLRMTEGHYGFERLRELLVPDGGPDQRMLQFLGPLNEFLAACNSHHSPPFTGPPSGTSNSRSRSNP